MALFGASKEEKEAKQAAKTQKVLEKYGLQSLSDPLDIESVKLIISELAGSGLMEAATILGAAKEKDLLERQMYNQRAVIEQNFIIIRQLDRIAKLLEQK